MGREIGWFGVVFGVIVLVMGCSGPKPTVEEERAPAMFQAVQQSLEVSPSLEALNRLLGQAESELNH
jgi:hypothetical protein